MPSWYPLVRAVKYYEGAYTVRGLAAEPSAIMAWALTAESAEHEGERIAREIAQQNVDGNTDDNDDEQ